MKKKVALSKYPTTEGLINTVPNLTAKMNGQAIATQGSILTHKTLGADSPAEIAPGITLNGMPLTFVGAKTAGGATIMDGGVTTASIKGATGKQTKKGNPLKEELSKTVELKSTYAMEQVQEVADQLASSTFYLFLKVFFHGGIPINAYNKLYKEMSEKKDLNPPIKIYKMGLGRDAAWHHKEKEIQIREKWVLEAVNGAEGSKGKEKKQSIAKAKSMLFEGLLEEYGHYIDYLLRNVYSKIGADSPGDEGALLKKYFLTNFDPFKDSIIEFASVFIDGIENPLTLNFKDFTSAFQRIADDLQNADAEFFGAGEGDALLEHYGHLGIENVLRDNRILSTVELSHLYLGNYMRDMSQVIVPPMFHINKTDYDQLRQLNPSLRSYNWIDALKITREGFTRLVELLAAGQMRKITSGKDEAKAIEGPGSSIFPAKEKDAVPESTLSKIKDKIKDRLVDLGVYGVQVSLDYWLFMRHYNEITQEELGVYRPEEHLDSPLGVTVYDELTRDMYYCDDDENPGLDTALGMKKHIRQESSKKEKIGNPGSTGPNYGGGHVPTAFDYMERQFIKFYKAYVHTDSISERNKALKYLGNGLHVLEDFFAHTNFCELSLIKVGISVHPWVDFSAPELKYFKGNQRFKIKDPQDKINVPDIKDELLVYDSEEAIIAHFTALGTFTKLPEYRYGGFYFSHLPSAEKNENKTEIYLATKRKGKYEIELALATKRLEYGGYNYAAQIPLVSGYFSTMDTVHSLIHAVESVFKPKDITFTGVLMANEGIAGSDWEKVALDISDMIILTVLNDLAQTQQEHEKSGTDTGQGIGASQLLAYYKKFIVYRAIGVSIIAAIKKKNPAAIFLGESLQRLVNTLYTQLSNMVKNIITQILELGAASITAIQNTELLREVGTNPSHTQLAKDHVEHPLHSLAAEYAKHAVSEMGDILKNLQQNRGEKFDFVQKAKELMIHPVKGSWMDQITINWVKTHGAKITELHSYERKRKEMKLWGDKVKLTLIELENGYKKLIGLGVDFYIMLQNNLKKIEAYIEYLKSIATGLTDKILKKYNQIIKKLDKKYEVFKEKLAHKTRQLQDAVDKEKKKLEKQIDEVIKKFNVTMDKQLNKAELLFEDVKKAIPESFEHLERQLRRFYSKESHKRLMFHKMDSENMLKYNFIAFMEESEPKNAERYKNLVAFQKEEYKLTQRYLQNSSAEMLAQLDTNDKDDTTQMT